MDVAMMGGKGGGDILKLARLYALGGALFVWNAETTLIL